MYRSFDMLCAPNMNTDNTHFLPPNDPVYTSAPIPMYRYPTGKEYPLKTEVSTTAKKTPKPKGMVDSNSDLNVDEGFKKCCGK